ncbi:Rha family transcriptional regulator [Rhizobium sp. SG741]|uniref:Rha family transcriptional regulator n=1 Tax=Rhizobium sp. SG741 TaxID=2587114 RepID=UPI001833728C|nr:Rha family transcriptional regulator [Rhizobium sp. SG741]NKJ03449.1 phage regulator Rha-like protein [Rhizobium sp. SG741]
MDSLTDSMPPNGGKGIRMSSREIAELTGKRHDHVKRDIEKLLADLGEDIPKFGGIYLDSMNREQTEYLLDRDMTENLLMGYSALVRQKVIARMRELEALLAEPKIPTTAEAFANAFRLLADSERRQAQQAAEMKYVTTRIDIIEQQAPLKAKPQNAETRSEVRIRMNRRYGLSSPIVDSVLDHEAYGLRPFGMVKNGHEDAQGSSYGVYWIRDISALFKRFASECRPHSETMVRHDIIARPFKLSQPLEA